MAFTYQIFDTTPANLIADVKAKILTSSDWSNPNANVVKCTTPLGAQMVVDLAAVAPTTQGWGVTFYRTYSGTTGVDPLTGYGCFYKANNTGTTATVPLHVTLIAGNTLLYIAVEGPRTGETAADTTYGSVRQAFGLAQLTPYFAADTIPQVVVFGNGYNGIVSTQAVNFQSTYARISQNMQASGAPWVTGQLMALAFPQDAQQWNTVLPNKGADGSFYLSPYVVFEHLAGLRGRLTDIYFAGANRSLNSADMFQQAHIAGDTLTIGGNTYTVLAPYRGVQTNTWNIGGTLGYYTNASVSDWGRSPLVAVRTA